MTTVPPLEQIQCEDTPFNRLSVLGKKPFL